MYKIAVVDDDEGWCLAVKSFFKKSFEITTFEHVPYSVHELVDYDLVIVDSSINPDGTDETNIQWLEIIRFLKNICVNPPLLVIATEVRDKNELEIERKNGSEVDAFFAKSSGLEELFKQTQQLLTAKNKKLFERSNQLLAGVKPMYTMAVVDDDKYWCHALDRYLRNEFEIYTFPSASDFLKQSFDFDVVLVDYSIPHVYYEEYVESRELIRYLKSLRYPPLVILVSGYVSKNDSALGKTICPEADAFVAKDAGLDELSRNIKDLLSCKR